MARAMVLMVIGALTGGAIVLAWFGPEHASLLPDSNPFADSSPSAGSSVRSALNAPSVALGSPSGESNPPPVGALPEASGSAAAPPGFASRRVAIYERVATLGDPETLAAEISRVAAEPTSRLRDLELDALLSRLSELDPAAAVELGRRLYLQARFLEPLFAAWAAVDIDAALGVIAVMQPPARQRNMALAVLHSQGGDPVVFEQIVSMLPAGERFSFEHQALLDRAEDDPVGAIIAALNMQDGSFRMLAARDVIAVAGAADPLAALAAIDGVAEENMRGAFQDLILTAWARSDPDQVFAWLESAAASELVPSSGMFGLLARADQPRTLALIQNLQPAHRGQALQGLVQTAAASDPIAAIPLLELMPPGQDRDRLMGTIGSRWGAIDPDQALAWAKGLRPPSENTLMNVLQGIASTDPDRAIDIVLAELDAGSQAGPIGGLRGPLISLMLPLTMSATSGVDVPRLLDRLVERSDPQLSSMLASTMSRWTREQPDEALNWALANSGSLDANALSQIARQFVDVDAELAINSLSRLAPEQRAGWLEGIVGELAQTDIDRAVSVLDQYRGQPGYDDAYGNMLMQYSRIDPQAAARLLDTAGGTLDSGRTVSAASSIAREWARRDPLAAANWVQSLTDPRMQLQATGGIAQTWAQTDPEGARRWLVGLSRGPARDRALDGYLQMAAQLGGFDAGLLDSYSNAALAEQGASRAIVQIARSDPEEAQRLLDTYVTDATLRQQAQRQIAQATTATNGTVIISGGTILVP